MTCDFGMKHIPLRKIKPKHLDYILNPELMKEDDEEDNKKGKKKPKEKKKKEKKKKGKKKKKESFDVLGPSKSIHDFRTCIDKFKDWEENTVDNPDQKCEKDRIKEELIDKLRDDVISKIKDQI